MAVLQSTRNSVPLKLGFYMTVVLNFKYMNLDGPMSREIFRHD